MSHSGATEATALSIYTLLWKGDFSMVNIPNKCPLPAICLHTEGRPPLEGAKGGAQRTIANLIHRLHPIVETYLFFQSRRGRGKKRNSFFCWTPLDPPLSDVTNFLSLWKFVCLYYLSFCVLIDGLCEIQHFQWKILETWGPHNQRRGFCKKIWVK